MISNAILPQSASWRTRVRRLVWPNRPEPPSEQAELPSPLQAVPAIIELEPRPQPPRLDLHTLFEQPDLLPPFVQASPVAMRYLELLGPLAWDQFPDRDLQRNWGQTTLPLAAFSAAGLIKLDQHLASMGRLRRYLVDNPALIWLLGFPLSASEHFPWGFDPSASLPTHRHLARLLHCIPNEILQYLLSSSVALLRAELAQVADWGQTVSLDTKHILAWVKENNPKTYVTDRFDKTKQPAGDPDCRLGCKRRHNQRASAKEAPPTPAHEAVPANTLAVGEFYWGYASGVVATQVPDCGEFVLAELTQPFDRPDVSYFFPLMATTERRLGFRPKFAALDAAFDAFYIYEHFHQGGQGWQAGFAAVPFSERGGHKNRQFTLDGLPICAAGLPMPLKGKFTDHSAFVEHECGRYVCPLRHPQPTADTCPINHKNWTKGGCTSTMPTSIGARLRYQIDRDSELYKSVYKQRTATERINSQAVELGIERPKLRNGQAIANLNTLIYVLINLRALQRIRLRKASLSSDAQNLNPAPET